MKRSENGCSHPNSSICIFSILFSVYFIRCLQEEFVLQSKLFKLVIIIVIYLMFDSWMMLCDIGC